MSVATAVILLVCIGGVVILLTAAVLPRHREAVALKQRLQADYSASRGYIHRNFLETVSAQLSAKLTIVQEEIAVQKTRQRQLTQERDAAIQRAASLFLIDNHLQDVPGIGPVNIQQIKKHVFRNSLSDLYTAERIQGIGPQKQERINKWIRMQKPSLARVEAGQFPGKAAINDKYQGLSSKAEDRITSLEESATELASALLIVQQELGWLRQFSEDHFRKAIASRGSGEQESPKDDLDRFIIGVYGPYERTPIWLEQAAALANVPLLKSTD